MTQNKIKTIKVKATIEIKCTWNDVREQIKGFLMQKNLDIVDGIVLGLRYNTFYEYIEDMIKKEVMTLYDVALFYCLYYGKDFGNSEKEKIIEVLK